MQSSSNLSCTDTFSLADLNLSEEFLISVYNVLSFVPISLDKDLGE